MQTCVTPASLLVPDAPRNLQLSLPRDEEGAIVGRWAAPAHSQGLVREYIVSAPRAPWEQQCLLCDGLGVMVIP